MPPRSSTTSRPSPPSAGSRSSTCHASGSTPWRGPTGPRGSWPWPSPIEDTPLEDLCQPTRRGRLPFLLVLDGITDPHNLGAVLRSAECAGVTGIVLPRHRSAHLSPTAAKVAAGAIEYLPMALVAGVPTACSSCPTSGW